MDRLTSARERLYGASPSGTTRAMCLRFTKAGHWEALANLYQALQSELDLPTPAISVSDKRGYGLWFSLAEAVPLAQAGDFLAALQRRYLADVPAAQLAFDLEAATAPAVPMLDPETSRWSAYIDPTLGAMFVAEPWLEMAPNPEKQADLLAALESIPAEDFERALTQLQTTSPETGAGLATPPSQTGQGATLQLGKQFADPQSFLLAVMNADTASAEIRVQAAIALLPYCAKAQPPDDTGG